MNIKVIYEDKDLLVVDKPAGIVVFPEGQTKKGTLIEELIKDNPELVKVGEAPRYGIIHRLDKDTSGILLVAKTSEALIFFQKQFINRGVEKEYICLVEGNIKEENGILDTFIVRSTNDPRKQTVYEKEEDAPLSSREAVTFYKVLKHFKEYTLLEVKMKTGRRHQIRAHMAYLQHPITGDKLYKFKKSVSPEGLNRQFLHAKYVKIKLLSEEEKEFVSELPEDLQKVLNGLKS